MKPILPFFISLFLASGFVIAQQIDLPEEDSAPAKEEFPADEVLETEDVEFADEPADEDAGDGITEESSEPSEDESAAESDEQTNQEAETPTDEDEDLFAESAASDENAAMSEDENEALAETEVEEELTVESEPLPPQPGMAVRVERVQGAAVADPSEVQLRAPFPAKLLAEVPEGWRIEKSDRAPAFTREVELSPGSNITLSVQPHILVPDADGTDVFAVNEPGYQADLGYRQDATVGAILATSIRQLDDDNRHLGEAIDQLQQLLVSLPRPEPAAVQDQPATGSKR